MRINVFGLMLLTSSVIGCGHSMKPAVLPDRPDAAAASKAMELYDTNHDGYLDAKELEKVPGLKAAIKEVAGDHADKISKEQIEARIRSWAESGIGRTP